MKTGTSGLMITLKCMKLCRFLPFLWFISVHFSFSLLIWSSIPGIFCLNLVQFHIHRVLLPSRNWKISWDLINWNKSTQTRSTLTFWMKELNPLGMLYFRIYFLNNGRPRRRFFRRHSIWMETLRNVHGWNMLNYYLNVCMVHLLSHRSLLEFGRAIAILAATIWTAQNNIITWWSNFHILIPHSLGTKNYSQL